MMDAETLNGRVVQVSDSPINDVSLDLPSSPTKIQLLHCSQDTIKVGHPIANFLHVQKGVEIEITGPLTVTKPDKLESATTSLPNGSLLVVMPIDTRANVRLRFRDNLRPGYTVEFDDFPVRIGPGAEIQALATTTQPLADIEPLTVATQSLVVSRAA